MFTKPVAPSLASQFARLARLAILGLLAPAAIRAFASTAGMPLRGWSADALMVLPLLAFGVTGVFAARAAVARATVASSSRTTVMVATTPRLAWAAAGFAACGALAALAFGSLQGLTGREPALVVIGVVVAGFGAGFGIAAAGLASALRLRAAFTRRVTAMAAGGGLLGGLLALLPFFAAIAGLGSRSSVADMTLAVIAAFGCVIVPYRILGAALTLGDE